MSMHLDLDDVAAQSPLAMSELAALRADAERLFNALSAVRKDFLDIPKSLAYEFTALPVIDAAMAAHKEPSDE